MGLSGRPGAGLSHCLLRVARAVKALSRTGLWWCLAATSVVASAALTALALLLDRLPVRLPSSRPSCSVARFSS